MAAAGDRHVFQLAVSKVYEIQEPWESGRLKCGDLHEIYYEQCGRKDGTAVVFLHGGPGGCIRAKDRQLFDPKRFRTVLFDQRGCGQSTPGFEIKENDTWSLVEDMERLRRKLGIDKWIVFGGSWGSLLALVYAIAHPENVLGLVIWGVYTGTVAENRWLQQRG